MPVKIPSDSHFGSFERFLNLRALVKVPVKLRLRVPLKVAFQESVGIYGA